jgi:hypothetical protein
VIRKLSCAVFLLTFGLAALQAGPVPVAYIEDSGGSVAYLTGYGFSVTDLSNPISLTLAGLAPYQAVIVASNGSFSEPTNIGDVLKQFADAGGGVVLTEFVFQGPWALGGGIMSPGYSPFTVDPSSSGYDISSDLGTINDPGSPLFAGVNTANVYTEYQALVGLDPGASLIASWDSGRMAFALRALASSSVVGLNLFPDGQYTTDPDTQRLVANALTMSLGGGGGSQVPEPSTLALLGLGMLALGSIRRRLS